MRHIFWSNAARVTLVFASMFCAWGMASPFLPRWLASARGLTGFEIGVAISGAQLARIALGPAIAAWADGFKDRRWPLRLLALGAWTAWAVFFAMRDFWFLAIASFAAQTLAQGLSPLIEGALLRATEKGHVPFGAARAVTSFAFVVGNIASGVVIAAVGLEIATPAWVLAWLGLMTLAAWTALPAEPALQVSPGFRKRLTAGYAYVARTPRIALLLIGCSCIQAAHAFYYSFSALVWRGQGLSAGIVGLLWGFAVILEIILLIALPRIERSIKPEVLILIGAGAGVVRWTLLAFAPLGWMLWPLQALHGVTFSAAHVGALRLITRECPAEVALFAQAVYAALQAGLFMGLATIASGWLYDHVGAHGYWLMSALAAIGFALIWMLRRDLQTQKRAPAIS